ncbi:MAG: arsenite methyltransferase [Chloroflexi bacterium]|nr:arsenite methyltransferase [Chloroflexota bacterium]
MTNLKEDIRSDVREHYAKRASSTSPCCSGNKFYQPDTLLNLPADISDFSLGCGDPITRAELISGETVLDLGSGGGLDCFLAAKQVGESGHVIGVDMTPEMLERAQSSAKKLGLTNVEFRKGYLEELPVEDDSVDVVISNCVINLSPDKPKLFAEVFRTLKPGGRISVSDIVAKGQIPERLRNDKDSWSACVSGALSMDDYLSGLQDAGFEDIQITTKDPGAKPVSEISDDSLFSAWISARKPQEI